MTNYKKSKASLPGPTALLAQNLNRICARLKGEIENDKAFEERLIPYHMVKEYMRHIKYLMPLLGVDFDDRLVEPVRSRILSGPLKWGQMRIGALEVLKKHGCWMTPREVTDAVLALKQVALTPVQNAAFRQDIREALWALWQSKTLERELELKAGMSKERQRYRLSRTRFRP